MNHTVFPDIKNYLSIQLYIKDIYDFRKQNDPSFSYTIWSQEIGIKSRSYLRLIITGKRSLTEEMASLFRKHLNLKEQDQQYFDYLVLYSNSKNIDQRNLYGKKLIQIIKKDSGQVEVEAHYDFVSDPQLPKLRTLLSYDSFIGTVESISKTLDLTEQKTKESLAKLAELNLIEISDQDKQVWKATHNSVKVSDHAGDLALEMFHTQSLNEVLRIQKVTTPQERRFRAIMMAMSDKEYQQFLENFQIFIEEQLSQHDTKTIENRRLYQMNFNLVPISNKISEQ